VAILLRAAKAKAKCSCCGARARTNVSFQGLGADRRATVDLCDPCRRLLVAMLVDEADQGDASARSAS